jgi:hypothetical protein
MTFNETLYRAAYAAIDNLIANGLPAPDGVVYTSALDYYNGYGKNQSGQEGFFTGSSGNDTITGSGSEVNGYGGIDVDLYGIGYTITNVTATSFKITPTSLGIGEIDTLVGRTDPNVEDGFFLSALNGTFTDRTNLNNPVSGGSQPLYVGRGNRDYGFIQNFTSNKDYVSLSGPVNSYNYLYDPDGDFKIYKRTGTGRGDLVGIVEVTDQPFDLQTRRFLNDGTFRLSARVLRRGFNEELYLKLNGLEETVDPSEALADYVSNGQFNGLKGIFTGAEKGSPTSASSSTADGNDTVFSYGANNNKTILSGVGLALDTEGNLLIESGAGANQVDVLIGAFNTRDEFWLGVGDDLLNSSQSFYVGGGSADYATIQNYQEKDRVILAGDVLDYTFSAIGSNIQISTLSGDLVGLVEGVSSILSTNALANDTFAVKFDV